MSIDSKAILDQVNMYYGRTFILYPVDGNGGIDVIFNETSTEVLSPEESIKYCADKFSKHVKNKKYGKMPTFSDIKGMIQERKVYLICHQVAELEDKFYVFNLKHNLVFHTNGRSLYSMNKTLLDRVIPKLDS